MTKFYDTCSLILETNRLFKEEEFYDIAFSSITLAELEHIKSTERNLSKLRDVRKLLHLLEENRGKYKVIIFTEDMLDDFIAKHIPINNDIKILATAYYYNNNCDIDDTIFVTNDLSLKNIANLFFGEDSICSANEAVDDYCGFEEFVPTEQELIELYSNLENNIFNLLPNQYVILRATDGALLDKLCWTGERYRQLTFGNFDSSWLGQIKPYKDDPYQALLADSLLNNQITMVKGLPGSGKTCLSLAYLMNQLERHKIERVIVFCNTVATLNSAKLGLIIG